MDMENALLILTFTTASLGFILWFSISSSLRLPVRYQIMYDANPPYVYRIFRRRTLGVIIYAIIPLIFLHYTNVFNRPSLSELNISYHVNKEVILYTLAGVAIALIVSLLTTRRESSLQQFPEVRVRFWRPNILVMSALSWVAYLAAYEFFYRGLLFQSLRFAFENDVVAIVACTAMYCLSHYFKLNRITITSIVYGALSCWVVLQTGSLIPSTVGHIALALFVEWFSIRHHKEMFVLRT